jgi:hypothetical protein
MSFRHFFPSEALAAVFTVPMANSAGAKPARRAASEILGAAMTAQS